MADLLKMDLLEYAKKYLITHMLESGMSPETIEGYISRISYSNPLRDHFANQLISNLPRVMQTEAKNRLLKNRTSPVVGIEVHTEQNKYVFPVSGHMNNKEVSKIVQKYMRSGDKTNSNNRDTN